MPTEPPLMSRADIIRKLAWLRYAPDNGRGKARKLPLKRVAEMAGLNRVSVYRVLWTGRISDRSREALSLVLDMLQTGGDVVSRSPEQSPALPQDRLVRASDWNEWARCRSCGGRRFSPVIMNGAKWFFCNGCLPPGQYPALGARAC
jgi:hypothetical protein